LASSDALWRATGGTKRSQRYNRAVWSSENTRYFETYKGSGHLQRTELEIELGHDQFSTLWPGTENRRLEKIRYQIREAGQKIELNEFRGNLEGLVLAEIEFPSRQKSREFEPPNWLGEEVTEDSRYKNQNLAQNGAPQDKVMRPR
jgi:adenylate cyclase